jgi:hypothetical protein
VELGLSGLNFQDVLKHVAQAARLELAFAMEANALVKQLKQNFVKLKNAKLVNHFFTTFLFVTFCLAIVHLKIRFCQLYMKRCEC